MNARKKSSPTNRLNGWTNSSRRAAFSLVELLTVMAIVALLSTFAGLGLSSVSGASRLGTSLFRAASYIDQARSYAVAHGTYVYVGQRSAGGADPATEFIVVGSQNGEDLSSQTNLVVGAGDVALLAKPLLTNQVNYSTNAPSDVVRPAGAALNTGDQKITAKGNEYQTLLAFGPSGTVTFGGAIPSIVEFGLRHSGRTSSVGVIQVAGLTGMSRVYQQ